MTHNLLKRPFIGISMPMSGYSSLKSFLPTPSYSDIMYSSYQESRIVLIYQLEGVITSSKQYRAISYLKIALREITTIPFDWIYEFSIDEYTVINNLIYSIGELSKRFRAEPIKYHKIYYPQTKEELYKHLVWWGGRLYFNRLYTKEAIISVAIEMNSKLELSQRYNNKEIHSKANAVYKFILENSDNFKKKLEPYKLKEAHKKGAIAKNINQANQTKKRIDELVASGDFTKPNGKLNKTAIGKKLNLDRRTIAKYF